MRLAASPLGKNRFLFVSLSVQTFINAKVSNIADGDRSRFDPLLCGVSREFVMATEQRECHARLLNVREAAQFLGTTPRTLYSMAWKREIVFVKIGRSLRFDVQDLEEMIEKSKVRPRPRGFEKVR